MYECGGGGGGGSGGTMVEDGVPVNNLEDGWSQTLLYGSPG